MVEFGELGRPLFSGSQVGEKVKENWDDESSGPEDSYVQSKVQANVSTDSKKIPEFKGKEEQAVRKPEVILNEKELADKRGKEDADYFVNNLLKGAVHNRCDNDSITGCRKIDQVENSFVLDSDEGDAL
ncbi:MAG: hypothetical protein MHMPM18_002049 [Marteilia pararefringens]